MTDELAMPVQGWWRRIEEVPGVIHWHLEAQQLCFPGFLKPVMQWSALLTTAPNDYWLGGIPS